ncbi:MAG TPA: UDP-N-acetylglucosamine 4,6-dehydratase (inverting) [Campylobacterales bacterium]|nr:UDP-N-acetylglucosamine 4,6-dehydratase (inverting) [Campylobacterales bacterium]
MFNDKNILITGGTGSFGKKFTKTLLERYKPNKIIIYSRDEQKHFEMEQVFNEPCMRYFIGDVRDFKRLNKAMMDVDFVIHAAAMKHVHIAEYNPMECINTNIHGAEFVIDSAIQNGVKKIIALSTDKAANPINLYGATKLASDKLFVAANNMVGKRETRFAVVRYGNVIGSQGSVVPYFQKLLTHDDELPITDERMTRFLITLQEGVDFVIKNFARMQGGEIFVPKIPSMKMTELALAMSKDKPYKVIGIRAGEKLHEAMITKEDSLRTLEFDDHYVIKPTIQFAQNVEFDTNAIGEIGSLTSDGFEYTSDTNDVWMSREEFIRKLD